MSPRQGNCYSSDFYWENHHRDSQVALVLAGNLPFSAIISYLPFSLNILPFFCNIPLAKESNVFPASPVFLARSFVVFLMYLGLFFLPLGHPSTSPWFFGRDNALDCLDVMRGLHSFDQIFILHFPCKQIPLSKIGTNRAQLSVCV